MNESEQANQRKLIVQLLTMMKANAELIGSLALQLEAVMLSVRGLDPTFDDVLDHHLKTSETDSAIFPVIRNTISRFDELILRVNEQSHQSATE